MKQWYVIRAKPRQEAFVAQRLEHGGIESYLPQLRVRRRGALAVLQPLFPSYLFARLDLSGDDYLRTRSSPGVAYFLGCDGAPIAVPEEVIGTIKLREQESLQRQWQPGFKQGDKVVIIDGVFKDLDAIFKEGLSAAGRVRVLVHLLQRWCAVQIDVGLLRRS